jgi:hypothetical protein
LGYGLPLASLLTPATLQLIHSVRIALSILTLLDCPLHSSFLPHSGGGDGDDNNNKPRRFLSLIFSFFVFIRTIPN